MKRTISGLILFCCAVAVTVVAQERRAADTPPDLAAIVEQLSLEVRRLQLELSEVKIELQQRQVSQAEEALKEAQSARERVATRRLELEHEIATIDSQLSVPELPAEARPELEARRLHLSSRAQEKLQSDEISAAQREAEVAERLEHERQRLQELTELKRQLRQKMPAGIT